MEIIKSKLTLLETVQFIRGVCDNCFLQGENNIDTHFVPEYKQASIKELFAKYYTDYKSSGDLETDYAEYSNIDLEYITKFNAADEESIDKEQLNGMLDAIDSSIDFRKQQLLQRQSNIQVTTVSKFDDAIVNFATTLSNVVEKLPSVMNMKEMQPFMENIAKLKNVDEKTIVREIVKNGRKNKLMGFLPKNKSKVNNKTADKSSTAPTDGEK